MEVKVEVDPDVEVKEEPLDDPDDPDDLHLVLAAVSSLDAAGVGSPNKAAGDRGPVPAGSAADPESSERRPRARLAAAAAGGAGRAPPSPARVGGTVGAVG